METQETRIGRTARGLLWILVLAAMAVGLLAAVNWLPSLMQLDFARQYDSIEEAKRAGGLDTVLVPAYFPEGISWPPSLILAQKKPYQAVVMEFREAEATETVLIVVQSSLQGNDAQLQRIRLSEVKEETEYRLKEKRALLQIGTCDNGMPCSRMTWQDGALRCTVLLMSSPFELIKIAESMVR